MKTLQKFKNYGLLVAAVIINIAAHGQFTNLQSHKEIGYIDVNDSTRIKRDGLRAKFEMLGFDSLGIYYWNTVTQYSTDDKSLAAQLQIIRGIRFSKASRWQLILGHQSATGSSSQYYAGVHHPFKLGRVKFLPFIAYVYNKDQRSANFRFTSGVSTTLAKNKVLIFGFVNAYTKDKLAPEGGSEKEIGFQANPQFWFRASRRIAIGGEIGVDYLRSRYQKVIAIPTLGARWTF